MASEADLKMERDISQMLRAGVSLAAAVVFIGGFLYVLQARGVVPDYRHFHGIPSRRTESLHSWWLTTWTVAILFAWAFCY